MTRFYIGANNQTGRLEMEKIRQCVGRFVPGYTLYRAEGVWNGKREPSAVVECEGLNAEQVGKLAAALKLELNQEAVGVSEQPMIKFV